jgi:hypothetical protein
MRKSNIFTVGGFLMLAMFIGLAGFPADATALDSDSDGVPDGGNTAVIDADLSEWQTWDNVSVFDVPVSVPSSDELKIVKLYLTNDETNIYVGIESHDQEIGRLQNLFTLNFDGDGDGQFDDCIRYAPPSTEPVDGYPGSCDPDSGLGGTNDVTAAYYHKGGNVIVEMKHPYIGGDPYDLALGCSQTYGVQLIISSKGKGGKQTEETVTYFPSPDETQEITIFCDNCIGVFNPSQGDKDGDGVGNACDNCPEDYNPDQEDSDGLLPGDACEDKWSFSIRECTDTSPTECTYCLEYLGEGTSLTFPPTCELINFTGTRNDGSILHAGCRQPQALGVGLADNGEGDLVCFNQEGSTACLDEYGVEGVSVVCTVCDVLDVFGNEQLSEGVSDIGANTTNLIQDPESVPDCTEPSGNCFDIGMLTVETKTTITVISVDIDIKPYSDPSSINLDALTHVPVAIFSSSDFDATTVDPSTVTLDGAPVRLKNDGTPHFYLDDVNGDGLTDMVVQVSTAGLTPDSVEATLMGKTTDGETIIGVDPVTIVQ